jgi:hypothetical protein
MTITKTGRRVAFLGLLALVVAILPLTAASAQDEEGPAYIDFDINEEAEASDALQTSILASQQAFPDGTDTVLLTTSEDGADALASGVLANDAALLYYNSDEGVVDAHVEEITRLGATEVIIIGGEERIDADVETALTDMGLAVTRLAGDERIATANEVLAYAEDNRDDFNETASHLSRAFGTDDNSQTAFADAVGLGAWDAQGGAGTVLAPSDADVLSEDYPTTQYFTDVNPENETIVPIGGEAAVPAGVVDYLTGEPAEQTAGDRVENEDANNRAGTAVAINEARGLDASELAGVVVVDAFADNFFIDAYAVSALAGNNDYAVVVSNGDELSPETAEWLGSPAFAQNDGTTDVICMPKTSSDACAEAVTATGGDPEDIETVSLDGEPEPEPTNQGIVIFTDAPGGTFYEYQPAEGDAVTVTYADDEFNTFTVDGTPATHAAFDAALTIGDQIVVDVDDAGTPDDDSDDITTHNLTNAQPATEGPIGFVDTSAGPPVFSIIEPVSGAPLSAPIDYMAECDLFNLNDGVVVEAQWVAALSIMDTFSSEDDAAMNTTCYLTDGTVAGQTTGDFDPTAGLADFEIGGLGDVFDSPIDFTFILDEADFLAGDLVITVDGETITDFQADFEAVLSAGDEASYSRTNDVETVSLTNGTPDTISGQAVEDDGDITNGFGIATNPGFEFVVGDFVASSQFVVNGFLATQADFQNAYSAGDQVSYTPEDVANNTPERFTLTDMTLSGAITDIQPGAAADGGSYDVLSSAGDEVLANDAAYTTPPATRLVLNGTAVTEADYEAALADVIAGDLDATVEIVDNGITPEHRLTTTEA